MALNIVDLVKDQISDQLTGTLSSALGTDSTQTTSALSGALPGLLSGLVSSAETSNGAGSLFNAVQDQDDGLLGNIGNLLGGDQASSLSNAGSGVLSSVLGSGALGQLAGVVANFAGISRGNSSSLLGMLAPIVIGVIKKQVMGGGMNASSLSGFLSEQKPVINQAMPQGFSDQLQSAGFFDSIANVSAPQAAAPQAAAPSAAPEAPSGGGFMKWALPLAVVVGLGWFAMQFFGKQDAATDAISNVSDAASGAASDAVSGAVEQAGALSEDALKAAQEAMPDGVDFSAISGGIEGVFGSATDALSGVTDAASAEAALPALEEVSGKLGGLNDVVSRLPDAAKGPIGGIVSTGLASVQPLIEKVSAIPGVGAIIEPIVTPMLEMLQGMAG